MARATTRFIAAHGRGADAVRGSLLPTRGTGRRPELRRSSHAPPSRGS
jgi:hypothetical protein